MAIEQYFPASCWKLHFRLRKPDLIRIKNEHNKVRTYRAWICLIPLFSASSWGTRLLRLRVRWPRCKLPIRLRYRSVRWAWTINRLPQRKGCLEGGKNFNVIQIINFLWSYSIPRTIRVWALTIIGESLSSYKVPPVKKPKPASGRQPWLKLLIYMLWQVLEEKRTHTIRNVNMSTAFLYLCICNETTRRIACQLHVPEIRLSPAYQLLLLL